MQWHKRIKNVQKLTLVVELWALLSPGCPPSLERTIRQGSSQEDSVHILLIAVVHWCLRAETHPCGNVVRAVVLSSFWPAWLDQLHIATAWSSRDMCVNWNKSRVSSLALFLNDAWVRAGGCKWSLRKVRVKPATRSVVATCLCIYKNKKH